MYSRLEKIPTQDLQPGLYVQQLDRPWTETPFVFQGFFIKCQDDIEELKHYCEYVFVDSFRGNDNITRPRGITSDKDIEPSVSGNVRSYSETPKAITSSRAGDKRKPYHSTRQVEREIAVAETIHHEACHAVNNMLTRLRKEGQLDMDMAQNAVKTMMQSVMRNPDAMVWLSKMKKFETYLYQHSINCTIWGLTFARYLGLDRQSIYDVGLGCMLFDVGKIRLPGSLLEKPAVLAPLELHIIRSHVEYSVSILEQSKGLNARITQMVRSHHERFDGSGYPDGLVGSSIPTFAKIAGMVDSYDAMLSPRPYARQYTPYEAIRQIYQWRGNLFQPEVVEQFMQVVGVFPTGTLVELNTGAVGVVIAQNDARRLRPRIMLLLDEHKRRLQHYEIVDLMQDTFWNNLSEIWINTQLPPGSYGIDPQKLYF